MRAGGLCTRVFSPTDGEESNGSSKTETGMPNQTGMTNDRSTACALRSFGRVLRSGFRRYGSVEIMSLPMLAVGRRARAGVFLAGG
jgi:hypothetical protein